MQLIDWVSTAGSAAILAGVVALIVQGRLKPRYALLWLLASGVLLTVSIWRESINIVGGIFGVHYRPALLFLAIDIFFMLILLHLSVAVSTLSDQVRRTAQELALLRSDRERGGASSGAGDTPGDPSAE